MAETLHLYYRVDCGLCEALEEELLPMQAQYGFRLLRHDVDARPEWAALYGERVPVLMGERGEICHFFLDPQALDSYFSAI